MKELFIEKTFGPESLGLIYRINAILDKYESQGYDLSLRQLYYQLVAADMLPMKWADPQTGSTNSERSYKNIGNLVSDARLAGLIDWDMIKDRARELITQPSWDSIGQLIRACANQYQIDMWERQQVHVEVMVEKQALEGVLLPVCEKLRVNFTANKGYSSSSALYEAGKRMRRKRNRDGKEVHIIYLGDHDPSGMDMTRDIDDRLRLFAGIGAEEGSQINVHRVALNMDQVRKLNPPENPAKITDSRAKGYIEQFGESSWELDAIEPRALAKLVSDAITKLTDPDLWAEDADREEDQKEKLQKIATDHDEE